MKNVDRISLDVEMLILMCQRMIHGADDCMFISGPRCIYLLAYDDLSRIIRSYATLGLSYEDEQ